MKRTHPRVLVVAPSSKAKGGIAAVVSFYRQNAIWKEFQCKWVASYIDTKPLGKIWYALKALFLYVCIVWRYDIVHVHVGTGASSTRKYIFLRIAKIFRKRTIVHLHFGNQLESSEMSSRYRSLFDCADRIVVLSESIAEYLRNSLRVMIPVQVIYNPCSLLVKRKEVWGNNMLYAGRLDRNKGYDVLIRGFAMIADRIPDWNLFFAGIGEIEPARFLVHSLGLDDRVRFLGWVEGDRKIELFREASILCLPSYAEGLPMTVIEAWSQGLPVVCTPVGALFDLGKDGENVLFFDAGNSEDLAEKLLRLVWNTKLQRHMSEQAIRISSLFEWKEVQDRMRTLYDTVIKNDLGTTA